MFLMVMLKKCSESVLWGMLPKYCACQRKCRHTAPACKNQLVAIFFASGRVPCLAYPRVSARSSRSQRWAM